MRNRDLKLVKFRAQAQGAHGYLKGCRYCGETIYMKEDNDGQWRPYESWVAGSVEESRWVRHECHGRSDRAMTA